MINYKLLIVFLGLMLVFTGCGKGTEPASSGSGNGGPQPASSQPKKTDSLKECDWTIKVGDTLKGSCSVMGKKISANLTLESLYNFPMTLQNGQEIAANETFNGNMEAHIRYMLKLVHELLYIIDWRVDGGVWHYDEGIPSGQDILSCYENIPLQFYGAIYNGGNNGDNASQSMINKVLINVPNSTDVSEWLKSNNVEFRVRYIYSYLNCNVGA